MHFFRTSAVFKIRKNWLQMFLRTRKLKYFCDYIELLVFKY